MEDDDDNHSHQPANRRDQDSNPVDREIGSSGKTHHMKQVENKEDDDTHDRVDKQGDTIFEKVIENNCYRNCENDNESRNQDIHGYGYPRPAY